MTLSNYLKELKNYVTHDRQISSKQLSDIIRNLRKISKAQRQANASLINQQMRQITPLLSQRLSQNQNRFDFKDRGLLVELRELRRWLPSELKRQSRQIDARINSINKSINNNNIMESAKQIVDTANKIAVNRQITEPQQLLVIDVQKNPLSQKLGIQNQVQSIKKVLSLSVPKTLTTSNVPQSVKLLDVFARQQGYLPMGSITNNRGSVYIGRKALNIGPIETIVPFPKTNLKTGQTPDIEQNYRYYAGKTINAWNQFVEAQSNMIQFAKKVDTKQGRKQFIRQKLKGMTIATFAAQALSTIMYYYFQIPLEKYMRQRLVDESLNQKIGSVSTRQAFLEEYKVATQIRRNPFLLNDAKGKQVAKMLLGIDVDKDNTTPQKLFAIIMTKIQEGVSKLAEKRIRQMHEYPNKRKYQSIQYFNNLSIPQDEYKKILSSGQIVDLKQKKFMIPSPFSNPQLMEIIGKITEQDQTKYPKNWSVKWGGQYVPCHDYVWDYQI